MSKTDEKVSYEEAKRRVIAAFSKTNNETQHMSGIAGFIWPGHRMRPQGAALAAGKLVARMRDEGMIEIGRKHASSWYGYRLARKYLRPTPPLPTKEE